jgi:hypothetical protein
VVLLNNDAFPQPDWLAKLHQFARVIQGMLCLRLLQAIIIMFGWGWERLHASGLLGVQNLSRPVLFGSAALASHQACAAAPPIPPCLRANWRF